MKNVFFKSVFCCAILFSIPLLITKWAKSAISVELLYTFPTEKENVIP